MAILLDAKGTSISVKIRQKSFEKSWNILAMDTNNKTPARDKDDTDSPVDYLPEDYMPEKYGSHIK